MRLKEILTEASLSPAQLAKRENWSVFLQKIEDKEPFELVPDKATEERPSVTIGYEDPDEHKEFVDQLKSQEMDAAISSLKNKRGTVLLPVITDEEDEEDEVKLTDLYKSVDFGRRGGKQESERQETGFVEAINAAVQENNQKPITVKTKEGKITKVVSANKVAGTNEYGKEPYADIAIHTKTGRTILVSAKGTRTPSTAGGGVSGLLNIDKSVVGNAIKKAYNFYKKIYGHAEGKRFPPGKAIEVFVPVPDKYQDAILKGTKAMGGPIDYMYVGPMDVDSSFDPAKQELTVNGYLIPIEKYMEKIGNLYLRIRRRRKTQVLDFQSTDKHGFPNIFYGRGEGGRRIVLISEKDLPKNLKKKSKDMYIGLGE